MNEAHRIRIPVYTPGIGREVRFLIQHGGLWRPVLCLTVQKEHSIYLAPSYHTVRFLSQGTKQAVGNHLVIWGGEGEVVTDPELVKRRKLSFHGSGIIGSAGKWLGRRDTPLRDLKSQESLCSMVFEHLSVFEPAHTPKKYDLLLDYPIDETRPLQAHLYVAPLGQEVYRRLGDSVSQLDLILAYPVITRSIRATFSHGPAGPWPNYTIIYWQAQPILPPSAPSAEPATPPT